MKLWPRNPVARIAVVGVALLVVLTFAAVLIYANVINDPDPELTTDDLTDVFAPGTSDAGTAGTAAAATETTEVPAPDDTTTTGATDTTVVEGSPAARAALPTLDGQWSIDPARSEFGYRVEEVLTGVNTTATGRGNELDGSITLDQTAVTEGSFTIEVASITSDNANRDNHFRGRVMETAEFPTASFTLTTPIELGSLPAPGEQVTATATGELTLHGETNPVTFEVTAQSDGSQIGVLGSIPVRFEDYGIDNPSNGVVTTEDDGLLEFLLVFVRA